MRVFKMILAILAAILGFYVINQTKSLDPINTLATVLRYDEDAVSALNGISTGIKALGFAVLGGGILMLVSSIKPKKELDIASFVIFLLAMLIGLFTFFPYGSMLGMADEDPIAHMLLVAARVTGLCLVLAASNIYDFIKLKKAEDEERYNQYLKAREEERKASPSRSNWGDDIEY